MKGWADHPNAQVEFKQGMWLSTQIQCANGETLMLTRYFLHGPITWVFRTGNREVSDGISAGEELIAGFPVYGKTVNHSHQWENTEEWFQKYDHPLWARYSAEAGGQGMAVWTSL